MMYSFEVQPKPERTPFNVRQAVILIPIKDYVQLRYNQKNIDEKEKHLLLGGAGILAMNLVDEGEIPPPEDLEVKQAREIVEQVPFSQYLYAKREAIVQALEVNATDNSGYEGLGEFQEDKRKLEETRQKLASQLDVIKTLIWKAN